MVSCPEMADLRQIPSIGTRLFAMALIAGLLHGCAEAEAGDTLVEIDQLVGRTNENGGCGPSCEGTVWLGASPPACGEEGPTVICDMTEVDGVEQCGVRFVGGAPRVERRVCQ